MPWLWIPPRGKLEKKLHFHRAVEMKQLHTVTEPFICGLVVRCVSIFPQYSEDKYFGAVLAKGK